MESFKDVFGAACARGDVRLIEEILNYHPTTEDLYTACNYGHLHVAKHLVEVYGVEVGTEDLFVACERGDLELVQFLVSKGAIPHTDDLRVACDRGHLELAQFLVSKGAIPDTDDLRVTCEKGHGNIVRFLISEGVNPGTIHLYNACYHNVDLVSFLIEKMDHRMIFQPAVGGKTVWHAAAFAGKPEIIRLLYDQDNNHTSIDSGGRTCFSHLFCSLTPLEAAIYNEKVIPAGLRTTQALINAGARIDAPDEMGQTMLHRATWVVLHGESDNYCFVKQAVQKMVKKYHANLEVEDNEGYTPFARAYFADVSPQGAELAEGFNQEIIQIPFQQLFIALGAKIDDALFQKMMHGGAGFEERIRLASEIPFYAAKYDNHEVLRVLANSTARDYNGCTSFLHACGNSHLGGEAIQKMIEYGCDVFATDLFGRNALHKMTLSEKFPSAQMFDLCSKLLDYLPNGDPRDLEDRKTILELRDQNGDTPLLYAIRRGPDAMGFEMVRVFVKLGADMNGHKSTDTLPEKESAISVAIEMFQNEPKFSRNYEYYKNQLEFIFEQKKCAVKKKDLLKAHAGFGFRQVEENRATRNIFSNVDGTEGTIPTGGAGLFTVNEANIAVADSQSLVQEDAANFIFGGDGSGGVSSNNQVAIYDEYGSAMHNGTFPFRELSTRSASEQNQECSHDVFVQTILFELVRGGVFAGDSSNSNDAA